MALPLPPLGIFDGVLLVDKPVGPTSHDIVNRIRRTFRLPKVGHGGTLDPNATGLLVILLGKGTKLSDMLMGGDKAYTGTVHLGVTTSSQDCDGEILETKDASHITREQFEAAAATFQGDIFQTPPMVSAIKINGVPLYKLARKGEEVERKQRFVHIYRLAVTDWAPPCAVIDVRCTKGTYIRTLAHDIGQLLGVGASLDALRRTQSGRFTVSEATPYDDILKFTPAELAAHVIPFSQAALP